ncbi:serine/threonine-protein kinase BLUS1 isoform X1 [Helianthus annuus]|uniref:serine/threonine-protein kinase BLUS1 isoform X1 n=1 Tax=Helianthus annuus TaxID=4232 RepID=UPI000B902A89|nr:serine/threonine-protein kinase BLUS1 isoform X1 [Helianthus annuus]XP_022039308.1 serine/threonine-protein kinase BLUS1 isoform X1 [Helianthus annuus]XP_022039310.1 serine/threonine-protein kinase BLUS1 isoform X1 [Helianthus annuus]
MKKYPIGAEHYELYEEIGQGVSASVYRAKCLDNDETVAIKVLDFERGNCDLNNVSRESQTMILVDHPNVLKSHCSFVNDHNLWVVMPFMAGGSCLHMLKAFHPEGFEEAVIATILREVLKALEYLHRHGHIHRDVKAGNILISDHGAIKLGDLGVSACLFDSGDRQRARNTFCGTPCWMAPEVMEQLHGYDFRADIWSFGITALELAHGHAPFSKYPPMKVLLMTLQNAPPGLDYERDKKFSKSFKQMIASCLVKDPSKRPSAQKLLKHYFFKQARSNDYIARKLLEGLQPIGDRLEAIKRKEEDMVAQKKIPDGQKEEISQNEYKRGISGWNFDLDDVKAQASLIQDEDNTSSERKLQYQLSTLSEASEIAEVEGSAPSGYSTMGFSIANCENSEDELSIASSANVHLSQTSSPRAHSHHRAASFDSFSEKLQGQFCRVPSCNETARGIQHKGRFKVTSGNVEFDKAAAPHLLQKSHSLQVLSQSHIHQPYHVDGSPMPQNHLPFPALQFIMQTNTLQRDCILSLMKANSTSDFTDGGCTSSNIHGVDKSMLDANSLREKELLNEITYLQWRLACAQEELQKCQTENF